MTIDSGDADLGPSPRPSVGPQPSGSDPSAWPDDRDGRPRWGRAGHAAWRGGNQGRWRPGHGRPPRWGGFFGCLVLALVLAIGLITALATWVAGTLLGIVEPGGAASPPTALSVLVVIVLAMVVMARIFARLVRPLASIADAAERLADGDAGVRVEIAGPGPVRRLAGSFNGMAERLDRSRADRQALLADVTHELRTPLQVIGGNVEAMLDGIHPRDDAHLAPLLAETVVMNRLLEDLRTLSLAEAGALPLHREEVDIQGLLADVAAGHHAAAQEGGVALIVTPGAAISLEVDPVRIREVVANLVVNAIRHTPSGGSIHLAAARTGAWVEVTVVDTGEGIAAAELERVFDRFHRRSREEATPGATSRSDTGGSGLGLTIARDLVAAHGGTIHAESDGIPGRGTTIRVRLPRRD